MAKFGENRFGDGGESLKKNYVKQWSLSVTQRANIIMVLSSQIVFTILGNFSNEVKYCVTAVI